MMISSVLFSCSKFLSCRFGIRFTYSHFSKVEGEFEGPHDTAFINPISKNTGFQIKLIQNDWKLRLIRPFQKQTRLFLEWPRLFGKTDAEETELGMNIEPHVLIINPVRRHISKGGRGGEYSYVWTSRGGRAAWGEGNAVILDV